MFGYVRPAGDLTQEQQKIFQSYYCGLCKNIKQRYGTVARMTLSFDCTFLALLLDSMETNSADTQKAWCGKRRPVITGDVMDICADINVLLAYYNAVDHEQDEGTLAAKGARVLLQKSYEQAKQRNLFLDAHIEEYLQKLWRLEREHCKNPELVADQFGKLLSGIADLLTDNDDAVQLCDYLGRYIYLLDAVDDFQKDMQKGAYNVYFETYGACDDLLARAEFGLECLLSKIAEHYERLPLQKNKELLDNIIYIGIIQYFAQERKGA